MLRGLDHLRHTKHFPKQMQRLRSALIGAVGEPTCEYELALVDEARMRETRFVSYSGPYSLGDRLPSDEQGREWIVIAVEETNGVERLVCEPAPQAS